MIAFVSCHFSDLWILLSPLANVPFYSPGFQDSIEWLLDDCEWIKKKTTLYSSQIVQPFLNVYTAFYNNTNKDGSRWIECPHKFNIILQWSVIIFISHLCLLFLCISLYYWIYIDFVICYRLLSLFILTVPQMYCAINYIAWT